MTAALAYETPGILTILIWSSFFVVLNVINVLLDKAIYCGLVGQIFIGVTWGKPGGNLLEDEAEKIVVLLGYLGLILLVYEGDLPQLLNTRNIGTKLTSLRWSFHIFFGCKVKFGPLSCGCFYRHLLADCLFIFPISSSRCIVIAGFCCWCGAMLYQLGNDLHSPQYQWADSHTTRHSFDNGGNA